jgi:hypothetical protein
MSEEVKDKKKIIVDSSGSNLQDVQDQFNSALIKNAGGEINNDLMKNMIRQAAGSAKKGRPVPRLAFAEDPMLHDNYAGIYKLKRGLLPDNVLKQIRVQNFLVAAILRARGNTLSMMGHIRKDRFDVGIEVDIKPEFKDHIEPEQMVKIQERIDRFLKLLINCGMTDGLDEEDKMTLPEFVDLQTRNGLAFGRFSTEIIYKDSEHQEFHRFRPVDAGTIYRSVKKGEAAENVRRSSLKALEYITGLKIDKDMLENDSYTWVQVINGMPKQAFTSKEMVVYNLYPSSDVEHNGYPVTPLDTVMTSITTHTSIEIYNKLYFQNGRAAKGMLVINSDEIDQSVIEDIKQQFNASINNVTNSFRTPIFGVSKDDKVEWMQTTPNKKDGEFEFLFDQTTRNILSAFNMSPDELPGFSHLSKGTNQQGLSEGNNEFKLIAARDTGIRPLILKIQDFLNEKLFPLIDSELSQLCNIVLAGFDSETKEQESNRLLRDMPVHYAYDEVMDEVDKELVGPHMMGDVPFNEHYRQAIDAYANVGDFVGHFADSPAAMVDPMMKYKRDQFFFQHLQTMAQFNPEAVMAYFATRDDAMDVLKMYLDDYLTEDDLDRN